MLENLNNMVNDARESNCQEYILMLENTEVLYFNFIDSTFRVIREDLLPYGIRGKIIEDYDVKSLVKNSENIRNWLAGRTLAMSRDNIKQICALFNISQRQSIDNKVNICLACRGVSLQDSYWVKKQDDLITWENVDINRKHLYEVIDVALNGKYPTVTADINSPELTTKGLFRKTWIRGSDGFYLVKSDRTNNNINTRMEILISDILDCTNIPHVQYSLEKIGDTLTCSCKCFKEDGYSYIDAYEVYDYCKTIGLNYEEKMLSLFKEDFANIPIIDYAIANTDRHMENYAFVMDNKSGQLVRVGLLYDHNQAGIAHLMHTNYGSTLSQMIEGTKYTIKNLADKYKQYSSIDVDFYRLRQLKDMYPEYSDVLIEFENIIHKYSNS